MRQQNSEFNDRMKGTACSNAYIYILLFVLRVHNEKINNHEITPLLFQPVAGAYQSIFLRTAKPYFIILHTTGITIVLCWKS